MKPFYIKNNKQTTYNIINEDGDKLFPTVHNLFNADYSRFLTAVMDMYTFTETLLNVTSHSKIGILERGAYYIINKEILGDIKLTVEVNLYGSTTCNLQLLLIRDDIEVVIVLCVESKVI